MKLFWGMIDIPIPHMHCYDGGKWKLKASYNVNAHAKGGKSGEIEYLQNVCLLCGDVIERKFKRGDGENN